jgi:hypothetical protein
LEVFSQTVKAISYLLVTLALVVNLEESVDLVRISLLPIKAANGVSKICDCQHNANGHVSNFHFVT